MDKIKIEKLSEWSGLIDKTFVIAGPCSAESEKQILTTAKAIRDLGVNINYFRAGIWKPRTRPNSFEGIGVGGLKWLQKVKQMYDFPVCVEVATPKHIEESLKYDVDALWIGARTTSNPFMVQEVANSLKGVNKPIFVKNPINPEIGLWLGAFERLSNSGVTKLVAVHRGFSTYGECIYRNDPIWRVPIELKRIVPNMPIICDPSHICGNKDFIYSISQSALNLLFDGLMIEVHIEPENALTDSEQQLKPIELFDLLNHIISKNKHSMNQDYISKIIYLRNDIDRYDKNIIELLAKRFKISNKIARLKNKNNVAIFQPERWSKVINDRILYAEKLELSSDLIKRIYQTIHEESLMQQENHINKGVICED